MKPLKLFFILIAFSFSLMAHAGGDPILEFTEIITYLLEVSRLPIENMKRLRDAAIEGKGEKYLEFKTRIEQDIAFEKERMINGDPEYLRGKEELRKRGQGEDILERPLQRSAEVNVIGHFTFRYIRNLTEQRILESLLAYISSHSKSEVSLVLPRIEAVMIREMLSLALRSMKDSEDYIRHDITNRANEISKEDCQKKIEALKMIKSLSKAYENGATDFEKNSNLLKLLKSLDPDKIDKFRGFQTGLDLFSIFGILREFSPNLDDPTVQQLLDIDISTLKNSYMDRPETDELFQIMLNKIKMHHKRKRAVTNKNFLPDDETVELNISKVVKKWLESVGIDQDAACQPPKTSTATKNSKSDSSKKSKSKKKRNQVPASSCSSSKPCPADLGPGPHQTAADAARIEEPASSSASSSSSSIPYPADLVGANLHQTVADVARIDDNEDSETSSKSDDKHDDNHDDNQQEEEDASKLILDKLQKRCNLNASSIAEMVNLSEYIKNNNKKSKSKIDSYSLSNKIAKQIIKLRRKKGQPPQEEEATQSPLKSDATLYTISNKEDWDGYVENLQVAKTTWEEVVKHLENSPNRKGSNGLDLKKIYHKKAGDIWSVRLGLNHRVAYKISSNSEKREIKIILIAVRENFHERLKEIY